MATATTNRLSFPREGNSKTIGFRANEVKTSANLESNGFYIDRGFSIRFPDLNVTAVVMRPFFIEITFTEEGYVATSPISNVYELEATLNQAIRSYI